MAATPLRARRSRSVSAAAPPRRCCPAPRGCAAPLCRPGPPSLPLPGGRRRSRVSAPQPALTGLLPLFSARLFPALVFLPWGVTEAGPAGPDCGGGPFQKASLPHTPRPRVRARKLCSWPWGPGLWLPLREAR